MSTRSLVVPEISKRFDVLRTLLVVFVIGIHAEKGLQAYYTEIPDLLRIYLDFFPHNIFRLSVPLFFSISGYLFFLTYKPDVHSYGRMILKKTRTILLPYLFFNAISLLLIVVFNKVPYIGDIHMVEKDGILKLLLGIYRYPVVYTLWFLRDLYVYFLLAPVFYVFSKEIPLLGLAACWAVWMFMPQAGIPIELSGLLFFYGGCVLSQSKVNLDGARWLTLPVAVVYLIFLFVTAHFEFYYGATSYYHLLYRHSMIFGTITLWLLSAYCPLRDNSLLLRLAATSFFVYLTHEPVLSYLIYGTRFLFKPSGSLVGIAYMLLLVLVTYSLCHGLARLLERRLPRLYALAVGAR
ncbi:acyltransferase family protein [Desulfovibrio sp. TomC]|uniref:acyltransferase family protein n=1 Tax=Desulfovibrio sp. TomC TaxID=1562888 RepID=UPI000574A31E|nr:acyltransferase [Desulfovibrio sp. TomC]KHK04252.1 putative succinyltransferase involved in succinoglycan biosynthesis [Desulfovibrio sp. TomC]